MSNAKKRFKFVTICEFRGRYLHGILAFLYFLCLTIFSKTVILYRKQIWKTSTCRAKNGVIFTIQYNNVSHWSWYKWSYYKRFWFPKLGVSFCKIIHCMCRHYLTLPHLPVGTGTGESCKNAETHTTAIVVSNKLPFVSNPGVSCLLSASETLAG